MEDHEGMVRLKLHLALYKLQVSDQTVCIENVNVTEIQCAICVLDVVPTT